jgi:hypothetical protein
MKNNRITFLLNDTELYILEKLVKLNNTNTSDYIRGLIERENEFMEKSGIEFEMNFKKDMIEHNRKLKKLGIEIDTPDFESVEINEFFDILEKEGFKKVE